MIESNKVHKVSVNVIIEDRAGWETKIVGNHGISLLLEIVGPNHSINLLFDASHSADSILHNMDLLNISPTIIDFIYLSHCHWDHTGGLLGMVKAVGNNDLHVICHSTLFTPRYITEPCIKSIGIPGENSIDEIKKHCHLTQIDTHFSLMPGVISSGEVKREVPYEDSLTSSTFIEIGEKLIPDVIKDDISLIINLKNKGLVIITGCSHAGIINIIRQAIRITDEKRIHSIIGGLHLIDADEDRIQKTTEEFVKLDVQKFYVGHCTGLRTEAALLEKYQDRFCKLYSGMKIEL